MRPEKRILGILLTNAEPRASVRRTVMGGTFTVIYWLGCDATETVFISRAALIAAGLPKEVRVPVLPCVNPFCIIEILSLFGTREVK